MRSSVIKSLLLFALVAHLPLLSSAQCNFTIGANGGVYGCISTVENVVWIDLVNNTATGNNLTKTSGGNAWNGGAASTAFVYDNGYAETTVTANNTARMFGLSTTDVDATYNTIQYAWYLRNDGNLEIYESGTSRGIVGTYVAGDVLQVRVIQGKVYFYKNGVPTFFGTLAPTLPLLVDVSINTLGGTLNSVVVSNLTDGNFSSSLSAPGAGASPVYQWQLNGSSVGSNSSTYSNSALNVNDVLICTLTPGAGGCSVSQVNSNAITIKAASVPFGDFYILATPSVSGCEQSSAAVAWNSSAFNNVFATGNNLTKIQNNGWDGGAASYNMVSNNGYLQFTATETNTHRMIGLSTTDASTSYTTIQYAIYLVNDGTVQVYESGAGRGAFGTYSTNDIFKITVEGNVVRYLKNGTIFYISTIAPTLPLLVDVSMNSKGSTLSNVLVSNLITGTFTAGSTNSGASPTYQWKLNGSNVGTNSTTYTNNSLSLSDVVTCTLTPNLGTGCTSVVSNAISVQAPVSPVNIDFYIQATAAASACQQASEVVVWSATTLANVIASGNTLTKFQSNGNWNGGAASYNTVSNNGYLQVTATENNTQRMIGLSTTHASSSFTTIQYAFFLQNSGNLGIYESGTSRGTVSTYAPGDILKISVESGNVKYYKNGTLLYISLVAPTLPLLVDVSINTTGGTLSNVLVNNPVTGTFTAASTNTGPTPTYQWKLNGANVGTNSTTYTNNTLNATDVLTCTIIPSLGGCSTTTYTSNAITISNLTAAANVDFYIQATASASACETGTEQVVWQIASLGNNMLANGNNLTKFSSNGNWDGGAASFNTVSNNGYVQFVATETTTERMIGLSTTNVNASYLTIQYAFYLVGNGNLQIYESGAGRGGFGTYTTGDILKVAVESGVVKYYKNGTLLYISTIAPTLPMLVDVSIKNTTGTLNNVVVSNPIIGTFTATATNVGASPTYQWLLNGSPAGTNSTTYTNNSLNAADVVTCTVVPNLGGCTTNTYTSNSITVQPLAAPANVDFYIQATPSASACQTGTEQVVWQIGSLSNVQATTNNLAKIQSNGNWDGGAASFNTVSNNGYMQVTASETTTARMIGLSTTHASSSYTTIQYAFYLQGSGSLNVFESGTNRGNFGTYSTNDVLEVAVESGVVKYYKNGVLLYISTVAPTLPLLVDVSINTTGGTLTNVIVSNVVTGTFTATATNVGASPTYQWKLNGTNVGTNSTTYTNNSLNASDVVTCTLVPNLGGCTTTTYTSNSITILPLAAPANVDFYIQSTPSASACETGTEQVVWQIGSLTNVQATGNNLTKIQNNAWDGGAASFNTVGNNGYMQFTASETNTHRVIGLSNTNVNSSNNTIQYGIYLVNNATFQIIESGTGRGSFGAYATSDIFKITVESNVVKYYKNGTLLYISTIAPTLPLLVDVSINSVGGTLTNVLVSNPIIGTFTATATNVGATPTYQWILNGANVGTNSTTYTNNSLVASDVLTCTLVPNLGGCSATTYTSNSITISTLPAPANVDFYITATPSASACQTGTEQVVWQIGSLSNVQASTNNLTKIQSNGNWDGGAASFNAVVNNGYMQFTATETTTNRMLGLSTTDASSSYLTIQYALYLQNTGNLGIYESGTNRGNFTTYVTGDILKVTVESGVVKYYKNGTLLYISTVAPTLPLIADASIRDTGGTLSSVIVSNPVVGTFTATATNVGASPTYQWKLNGGNVGTNSTTYTNNSLNASDVVTCTLVPNLGGCTTTTYTSNSITILPLAAPANVDFYIQATPSSSACETGTEQVVWQIGSLTNVQATGNNLTKIQNNAWDGGAASFNTVANNGYMQFTASETNTHRVIGLSNTNVNSSNTTVQYGIYLVNNATFQIIESGTGRGTFGAYATGDIFKITVESNVVKYYKNGTLVYISTVAPTLPLLVDVSINSVGGTLTSVLVSNPIIGTFTATATNVGATPTYQWILNGANVGTNSTTYTNNSLVASDVLTCTLVPNLGGCSATTYTSNSITISTLPAPANVDFYIVATPSASACQTGTEQVAWQIGSLNAVQATGNSLVKIQSNGNWDGGAASFNTVVNNGYLQLAATENTNARMIGLSTTDASTSYTTIQYAFYLQNNGNLAIYESGTNRGNFSTYIPGDILKIAVESGVVKYYKNGTLLYISTIAPTLPLIVDVSIRDTGGTLTNVLVNNPVTGTFTATATNVGATPTYQWKLNGTNVGTNTTTYVNNTLAVSDVVTCQLTPSLGGCSTTVYTSNSVTMANLATPANVDFYIQSTVSTSACQTGTEQAVWQIASLNTNMVATGNNLTKFQSNNVWDGGAASFNTVSNSGNMQFTASETNTYRMIGLSNTNTDANYTSIQYAIYLINNATVQIYESGVGRGNFGTYATNDIFNISVESGVVKYYKNGTLLYISAIAPTLPLLVDVSVYSTGGTVSNVLVTNPITGSFMATATNVGASPTYLWKLNGTPTGTNSNTYTNTSLSNNDVLTCQVTPNLGGCSATSYTSNSITISTLPAPANVDFYIQATASASACETGTEQVVWQIGSLTNVQATGNNLTKIQSNGNWDGGAASFNTVSNNGYMQFVASETNTERMVGLSTTNANSNYTSIQYAVYLTNTGALQIYESGTFRGSFGTYVTGDIFKVSVESSVVKYYKNGTLLFISAIAPTLPLLVDISIKNTAGTITNVVVSNPVIGTFTATATNIGATPIYQWKLNGGNVGTNSTTYTNNTLNAGDIVTCQVTPSLGGCSTSVYTSNTITISSLTPAANVDFYIQATASVGACETGTEQVVWQIGSLTNVQATGNNLTKIQSNGNWDGGAASFNTVSNGGYMQFTASETTTNRVIGLSTTNANSSNTSIQYGLYLVNNATIQIIESGTNRGTFGAYATSDILKVTVESNVVKYYRNATLLYISTVAPTLPLLVDVSINNSSGTLTNVLVSNPIVGTFTATATNVGATPTYQWLLNGNPVGTNVATYTNNSLNPADVITCKLVPSLGGCTTTTYTSNSITISNLATPANINFYIQASATASGCQTGTEQVVWQIASLSNVQASTNNLTKIQSNGNWDGGAASFNTVVNNGYMQFTATETTTERMIGLSTTDASSSYTTIQYAIYLVNTGALQVYESGTSRGGFGTYATGDIFKITVEGGVVKYYKNGTVFYVSTVAPTLPLLVDVSIKNTGGTLNNVVVSNPITGTFTATATNVGATPTYQWLLNGANAGTNSNVYTNNSITNNDVVTCKITPSLGGCSLTTYTSNSITVSTLAAPANIDFYIQATVATSACETANEQVVWQLSSLTNVQASTNNLTKILSNGNWDGGAASFDKVSNNGFMQFTASETNTERVIGFSNTNVNSSNTTIQYGIYLVNTAAVQIIESGTNRGAFGTYATSDIFKITVESGVVKYYKNGTVLYISTIAPTLPLLVDVSIKTLAGTVSNVIVSNPITGTFTATATNVGATPTYQWKLNGANVGTNSTTYTNTSLLPADVLTCIVTANLGGCGTTPYTSNSITINSLATPANVDFYVQATPSASACQNGTEQVVWQIASLNNVQASTNNLTKTQNNGVWDGGAASFNTVSNNGYMQFTATETTTQRVVGLSNTNANSSNTSIQYGIYLVNNATFQVIESGTSRGTFGAYATSDIFKITVESTVVKYYKNGTLVYISGVAPTLPLLVDVSINSIGGTISSVLVSNPIVGSFTATATNVGASPTYQWKLNGTNVGTNTNTYTNNTLNAADVVTCQVTPNLGGCTGVVYTSNSVTISTLSAPANIDFYVQGTFSSTACQDGIEQVVWQISSLTNVQATGNSLNKIQSGGNWDGGAASFNMVNNNGYMTLTASETTTNRMIGLSTTNANSNYTSIQYALYLQNTGALGVYESGTSRGNFGTYTTNDILKVAVDNGVVKYYRNNVLLYTSGVVPVLPMLVDVSINALAGTLNNVTVTNQTTGVFTATATNAGATPTYQWKLNGVNVGTNSTTYSNGALANNDVITCVLTPNLGNCTTSLYTSNSVKMYLPGAVSNWTGTTSTLWDVATNWSNGVPDRYTAVTIPSGTPNAPTLSSGSNVYDITINSGATLTMTGSPVLSVYRNWTNGGAFTQATSTVNLVGCAVQNSVTSTATETFYKLIMNNANGAVVSTSTQQISNNLALTNGIITNSSLIQVQSGATATGASNTSYVAGQVRKVGNAAFTFPVGKAGFYRPISISAPGTATDSYTAEYFHAAQAFGTAVTAPIIYVSGCEYWNLTRSNGVSNVTVTLSWNEAACHVGDITTIANLRVAEWTGATWANDGIGTTTGTTTNGTISSVAVVSVFGPFTLATTSTSNPLPIELESFTAQPVNGTVLLNWLTASELNNDYFTVERSTDASEFISLDTIKGAGTTRQATRYQFTDINPGGGDLYYRLKQTDFDGKWTLSKVLKVNMGEITELILYPNPVQNGKVVTTNYNGNYIVYNSMGQIVKTGSSNKIDTSILAQGVYIIKTDKGLIQRLVVE